MINVEEECRTPNENTLTEFVDIRYTPICYGDLLRSFHFFGRRQKRHYLYHVAVKREGQPWAVPVCHLEPSITDGEGVFLLSAGLIHAHRIEVLHGSTYPAPVRIKAKPVERWMQ